MERSLCSPIRLEKDRQGERHERPETDQDMVARIDDRSDHGRIDVRRAQRAQIYSGVGRRRHDRAQIGRIRADPHVQGPRREQKSRRRETGKKVVYDL